MKGPLVIGVTVILGIAAASLLPSSASAASIPPFCTVFTQGKPTSEAELAQLVSGAKLHIECDLKLRADAPNWLLFKTDGDPTALLLERLDETGKVVDVATYTSPEVIVPADDYRLQLDLQTPQIVEVLTRESGLREEVARPQTKTLLTVEVRAAPNGSGAKPELKDLATRIATIADMKTVVVHPYHLAAQQELLKARTLVDDLKSRYGATWEGAALLDRDLALAEAAIANGQLDRVDELSQLVRRYAAEGAEAVQRVERIDEGRTTALRIAVIAGAIATFMLILGGIAAFGFYQHQASAIIED